MTAALPQPADAPQAGLPALPARGAAPVPVLPWEQATDYAGLREALVAHHAPVGPVEEHLVEEIAGCIWRKRRLYAAQAAQQRSKYADLTDADALYYAKNVFNAALRPHAPGWQEQLPSVGLAEIVAEAPDDQLTAKALARDCGRVQAVIRSLQGGATLEAALAGLPAPVQGWWEAEDADTYPDTAEGLAAFLELAALPELQREALARRYAGDVRAQLVGLTLDVQRQENYDRHERHLDAKLEKTLAMLVRLQQLRSAP